ncbi:2OG-Fe(II) oxygenase [Thiomicrorhabdus lithotrophica]|uniref:2OG-Fe(II) oxygenase n=1 Tax=Thiomicrorhabdus lithotrophica TaxID=2949997 RepID=A0ABY8CGI1_9GAMM|nr:2OG-Fe(II) oxygenase [Thiomicrorhabdus lithotrophica]WEJ63601.1 2OG-Fe(II) oxygenase [Thiomicrorhabdus lithotrophica]
MNHKKGRVPFIRMKRYLPNTNDSFSEHVDVSNYASAKRFLVFFIYLNDDFEGGETSFKQFNIKAKPKQVRMILFPPMWSWLHQAYSVKGITQNI